MAWIWIYLQLTLHCHGCGKRLADICTCTYMYTIVSNMLAEHLNTLCDMHTKGRRPLPRTEKVLRDNVFTGLIQRWFEMRTEDTPNVNIYVCAPAAKCVVLGTRWKCYRKRNGFAVHFNEKSPRDSDTLPDTRGIPLW